MCRILFAFVPWFMWCIQNKWIISDIALFVLKRDVKLQPTNLKQMKRQIASVCKFVIVATNISYHHNRFTALFWDHPGEPVPEENFWTLWCKGRLTEADRDHLAGRHSVQTNQCPPPPSPPFFTGWMSFLPPSQQSKHWRQPIIS